MVTKWRHLRKNAVAEWGLLWYDIHNYIMGTSIYTDFYAFP